MFPSQMKETNRKTTKHRHYTYLKMIMHTYNILASGFLNLNNYKMDVTELRIGNWVNLADKGNYQIDNGHEIDTIADWFDLDKDELDEDQYATPIVLTEKWLINFGFKKKTFKDKLSKENHVYFEKENIKMWSWISRKNYAKDTFVLQIGVHVIDLSELDYVHQLQNLYHPLTGEELELAENTATVG